MSYISTIKIALILFPILAFVITIPYMIVNYRKYGSVNKLRTVIFYSFILYLLAAYSLVNLPLPDPATNSYDVHRQVKSRSVFVR